MSHVLMCVSRIHEQDLSPPSRAKRKKVMPTTQPGNNDSADWLRRKLFLELENYCKLSLLLSLLTPLESKPILLLDLSDISRGVSTISKAPHFFFYIFPLQSTLKTSEVFRFFI